MCSYCRVALHDIPFTCMAQYSLCVLKVPLNTNQTNKQYQQIEEIQNGDTRPRPRPLLTRPRPKMTRPRPPEVNKGTWRI